MRVWIGSFVVVAACVATILYFTRDGDAGKGDYDPAVDPPAPLEESEVRTYLEVWPAINEALQRGAQAYSTPGQTFDSRAAVDAVLRSHHLAQDRFDLLRRRVEYVVDVLRWETELPEYRQKTESELARLRDLQKAAKGETLDQVNEQIGTLEKRLDRQPPPIAESDRKLVMRFWKELDALAPRRR